MDETTYLDLSVEQWRAVRDKASGNNTAMFILRCWANSQAVSWGTLNAFAEKAVSSDIDRKYAALHIGNITKWVQGVTSSAEGRCYVWNKNTGEWLIGFNQCFALREALGVPGEL